MVDFNHPRHAAKVMAESDEDQAELCHYLAQLARDAGDDTKAEQCEQQADAFRAAAAFMTEIAPDLPR